MPDSLSPGDVAPAADPNRVLGRVYVARKCYVWVPLSVTASSLTSTPTYSNNIYVDHCAELLVLVSGSSIVGSGTGLQVTMQLYEEFTQTWFTYPTSGTISVTAQTGTNTLAVQPYTNFGAYVRFGMQVTTNSFTGGTFNVTVKGKT